MSNVKLTEESRSAINSYLGKWLAALGLVNLIAIVTGLSYIFFYIPIQASNRADVLIEAKLNETIAPLKDKAVESMSLTLIESAKLQERSEAMRDESLRLTKVVEKFRTDVRKLRDDDLVKVAQISDILSEGEGLELLYSIGSRLDEIESDPNGDPISSRCRFVQAGGSTGATWPTSSKAMCASNEIATGGGCTGGSAPTGSIGRMANNTPQGFECIASHPEHKGTVVAQAICCK
ncbi:hypothetical protein N9383_06705 [Granulosicoccus sp.]|nr:hypothetical protein [Granulosicoccus sp.]